MELAGRINQNIDADGNFLRGRFRWEYWPAWLSNLPVICFWLYYSIKARNLFFVTQTNPAIHTGGVFGESKVQLLNTLEQIHIEDNSASLVPQMIFIDKTREPDEQLKEAIINEIGFPCIAKPDIGQRGMGVQKINNREELGLYPGWQTYDFIIQKYIDYPVELAVMYHRYPGHKGKVTSMCIKSFLTVLGDGSSTIRDLMRKALRSSLQIQRLDKVRPELMNKIPQKGEQVQLEPIGNHCLGTEFINANDWIDDHIHAVFDRIGQRMNGIHFGRFDLRCRSLEDLRQGKHFSILEFNGASAEAAHVYDQRIPIIKKYQDILSHWRIAFEIAQIQKRNGISSISSQEFLSYFRQFRKDMKILSQALNAM